MFRKILVCAVLASPLVPDPALAGNYHGYETRSHRLAGRNEAWSRPVVLRGYYEGGGARRWSVGNAYGRDHARFHHPRPLSYAAAAAWYSYTHGYRTGEPAYAPNPQIYSTLADAAYAPPVLGYRNATAYVPVTTYAPVPARIYYVPQHEPYYNVPPYAVLAPCFCQ